MRRDGHETIYGPRQHRRRWRIILVAADGARRYRSFASEQEADAYIALYRTETESRTVSAAVDLYVEHLRVRGLKPTTIGTIKHRLKALLDTTGRDRQVHALTPAIARELFARRTAIGDDGQPITSGDTQAGELAAARGFAAWCVRQGWLRADPFAGLEPTLRKRTGKAQLRIDEARRYLEVALGEGSREGLAAALPLLLGLRASEVTDRVVRDVDDGARVLWIERAKTRAGDRRLEVPELVRPRLAAMVAGRGGGERLWGDVDRHWLGYHVRRLCGVAGVPEVTPHGLRGTWSSLSIAEVPVDHVARALGHVSSAITRRHYLGEGVERDVQQRAALRVLEGGVGNAHAEIVSHEDEARSA